MCFPRLDSHCLFDHHFCRVERPKEKGIVERSVKFARLNFLVPVPSGLPAAAGRPVRRLQQGVDDRQLAVAGPLRRQRLLGAGAIAHHPIVVRAYADRVVLCHQGLEVAEHPRRWGREGVSYNLVHYLALLERKPGAFDFARPMVGWEVPSCFGVLCRLEAERDGEGTREYIRMLYWRDIRWAG
jgi:hypothetical protein